ncbi:MAG: hypothetical protein AAF740_04080 [Bacteroidota bacterium]
MKTSLKFLFLLLLSFCFVACSDTDDEEVTPTPTEEEEEGNEEGGEEESAATIWEGATLTFSKSNGADPEAEANQDRLTDNVWITRGNDGGQIFNIRQESGANKQSSPAGTLWAEGTLSQINELTFEPFRAAVGNPQNVVGRNLVMYLEEDDTYLSVRFTSWNSGNQNGGGFSYERSTPN